MRLGRAGPRPTAWASGSTAGPEYPAPGLCSAAAHHAEQTWTWAGLQVGLSMLAVQCNRTSLGSISNLECTTRLTLARPAHLRQSAILKQPGDAFRVSCRRGRTRLGSLPVGVAHISRARRDAVRQQLPMDHHGQVAVCAVGGVPGHNLDLQQAGRLLRGHRRAGHSRSSCR